MTFQNQIFYKILKAHLCHHGFQYKMGLNIDTVPFNPSGTCESGGLYFTDLENICHYLSFGTKLAFITIPDDAKVYKDPKGDKYKADRIYINAVINIQDFEYWNDQAFCVKSILKDCSALQYAKYVNESIYMESAKQSRMTLKYIQNQTPELCMKAVQRDHRVLRYVKKQTPELCLVAVQQNGRVLRFVQNQTPEICAAAVQKNWSALKYVENQTPELCLIAVQKNGRALQYVQNQTPEICIAAAQQDDFAKYYINIKY